MFSGEITDKFCFCKELFLIQTFGNFMLLNKSLTTKETTFAGRLRCLSIITYISATASTLLGINVDNKKARRRKAPRFFVLANTTSFSHQCLLLKGVRGL